MIILGDKDIENNTVSVRARKAGDLGAMTLEEYISRAVEEIETKVIN